MDSNTNEWILHGLRPDDPRCIHSPEQLQHVIDEKGFLPLFANEVPGFSVEEMTVPDFWWNGNERRDPWEWRRLIAAGGQAAYGKFFNKKAGFVALEWLPRFINLRREGYDFEGYWEDGKANRRAQNIMKLFDTHDELFSFEIKKLAGFGKGGDKNFEGTVTDLMMQTFLTVRDFRPRLNKHGFPYGWHIAVYSTPEKIWGADMVNAAENESPEESQIRILHHLQKQFPYAPDNCIRKLIR